MSPAMSRDVDLRDGNVWAETSAMSQELLRDIARHRHFVTTVSTDSIPAMLGLPCSQATALRQKHLPSSIIF